ncbi:protein hinderin [Limanda limanda]|uniref:protein hinderin n=1 Tax=Limanda limanda TaxID=27771 RepID=UPI0029C63D2C|nr:protein hinderin [Limanda limanda]
MAAGATRGGSSGIFWMNDVSDDEPPFAFGPGLDGEVIPRTPFNLEPHSTGSFSRGATKMRVAARRSSGCKRGGNKQGYLQSDRSGACAKEKVSVQQSAALSTEYTPSLASDASLPPTQVISTPSRGSSQVCLKDLCSEDKRRIANLIEELARVSEEKEESVKRLKDEQGHFEQKIQQLEQHNVVIAEERESLQQQYRECHELLGLYQTYLSQQQSKLNESIAQLSQAPAHSKVLGSDAATSKANGSLFDGSYLGLPAARARQPQEHRSGNDLSASELSPNDGPINMQRIHKKECRQPHVESCYRCERCQASGQDSGYGTQQRRRDNSSRLENGQHDALNPHDCERLHSGTAMGSEAKEALTRPLLGHEGWEEKRHQLLLQKMQLEMEREKLQARLEEQEERLNRQNQQLQESRLDYSRFQQAAQAELSSSNTGTGDPRLEGPSHQDLPSSVRGEAEVHRAEQNLHGKCSQPAPAPVDNGMQTHEPPESSRRNMATTKSPAGLSRPTPVSALHKNPEARLDFSLVELLDIISPVSAPEPNKPSNRRTKMTQHRPTPATPKPMGRSLLKSATPHPQSTQQDLEESQILEDIFFIH